MMLNSKILVILIICSLIRFLFGALAKNKTDYDNNYHIESFHKLNSDRQLSELYNEILNLININKKKDNVTIDKNSKLDSSLICYDKVKKFIEGKVLKIFYHDSENVYFNFEDLYEYLGKNNYRAISNCMADGPDGTDQVYLKNRVMLLVTGQWDGGDDSDTTYIPSKYFEFSFYLMKLNKSDSAIISNE